MSGVVWVGLGSNLGDRIVNLALACQRLAAHPGVRLVAASSLYETPPMGPPQGEFLNAVIGVETTLSPVRFLQLCTLVEDAGHRVRDVHWGPRTIDVDVLDFAGKVKETPKLRLPHPGIAERSFVLCPLAEAAPDWRHPVTGDSAEEMLHRMDSETVGDIRVISPAHAWCRIGEAREC